MTERVRSANTADLNSPKMESDLSPRKTMLVLVVVVGCFAVLWPKVFYPMLLGSANQHIKPSPIDKAAGCCDVISDTDVNTIKIMSELCGTIIKSTEDRTLTGKEIVQRCRQEVLETCGIDISAVLQEQVRLGQSVKQILDEVRSLNGSLCLKYNYGVAPWRLGVPHRITIKTADATNIRQERPMHLRSELIHPAFRERGRAIPQPQPATPARPASARVVEGRPGPIPGMRPTIGGAGHIVPPPKQGTSSMSIIMPIYTIGIVIFFTYTLMKIIFKKQPEHIGGSLYPPIDPDPHFRKEVFESESSSLGARLSRDNLTSKLVVNAMSALLDEVDQEIEARRKSSEIASQDLVNGTLSNGDAVKPQDEEQPTVKILGMEMTASCEGGKKWSRPESPVLPTSSPPPPAEPVPPPQEIYLEGALPAQSQLLVADSATRSEPTSGEDPAVVLSGKMTLSVISLDSDEGAEPTIDGSADQLHEIDETAESLDAKPAVDFITTEDTLKIGDEIEKSLAKLGEETIQTSSALEKDIQNFLQKLKEENSFETPTITVESESIPNTVQVENLEKEVEGLIQEALESIQQKEETNQIDEINAEVDSNLKIDESTLGTDLQPSNNIVEIEKEISPNIEIGQISDEIGKLIQEINDLPTVERKVENSKPDLLLENQLNEKEDSRVPSNSDLTKELLTNLEDTMNATVAEVTKPNDATELINNSERASNAITENVKTDNKNENFETISVTPAKINNVEEALISELEPNLVECNKSINSAGHERIDAAEEEIPVIQADSLASAKTINIEETVDVEDRLKSAVDLAPTKRVDEKQIFDEILDSIPNNDTIDNDEEVEEMEEIVYEDVSEEEDEEEEIEIEVEESEEEFLDDRNTNRTAGSSSVQRVNGERSEDVEESKYTTVSGATAAEYDISDEELIDDEDVEEEIIEIEEDEENYINDDNNLNHISGDSEPEH